MDNAQKAIMIGVGLFITIIIISVVLLITNLGTGLSDSGTEKVSGTSSVLQKKATYNELRRLYNGTVVTREQVFEAYENYKDSDWIVAIKVGSHTYRSKEYTGIKNYTKSMNGNYYIYGGNDSNSKLRENAYTEIVNIDTESNVIERLPENNDLPVNDQKYKGYLLYQNDNTSIDTLVAILFLPIT